MEPDKQQRMEEQITRMQKSIKYDLRSFSNHELIRMFRNNDLYIPSYQRNFVWDTNSKSKFIETMIIGLPTSLLFFAETDDGRTEIIDGVQRISTLEAFSNEDLILSNLEVLTCLNDSRFSDLSSFQQRKFLSRAISAITLYPETGLEQRLEIFSRINASGVSINAMEMRMAWHPGPFIDFIKSCSNSKLFWDLFPLSELMRTRGEAEELLLRFFALSDDLNEFNDSLNSLLSNYLEKHKTKFDKKRLEMELEATLLFIARFLRSLFASKRRISRTLFESITVGVNLALREQPNLIPSNLEWIDSEEFSRLLKSHAIQNRKRVKERILFVKDSLLKAT